MVSRMVCGYNGLKMEQKNLKRSSLMEKEIVYGPHGMSMEIKSFKQHMKMAN